MACLLHHSIHSLILRMTAIDITRTAVSCIVNCNTQWDSQVLYSIWIKKEFAAGIHHRCLVSLNGMLSAPAGNHKAKSQITCHTWIYNKSVRDCTSFSNFYTAGEPGMNINGLKGRFIFFNIGEKKCNLLCETEIWLNGLIEKKIKMSPEAKYYLILFFHKCIYIKSTVMVN